MTLREPTSPSTIGRTVLDRIGALERETETASSTPVSSISASVGPQVLALIDGDQDPARRRAFYLLAYERAKQGQHFHEALGLLAKARGIEDEPELAIEQGKLALLLSDTEQAYQIFKTLCGNYASLTYEDARETAWFLFKTLRMKGISIETRDLFQEEIRQLFLMQDHFKESFEDILKITELALAFQRGQETSADNEGSTESGYDETIRLGEALPAYENPRVESDRRRLIGAAYLKKGEARRDFYLQARPYCGHEGREMLRREQLDLLVQAESNSRTAVVLLSKIPGIETEGGELFRTMYNYTKTLCIKAAVAPGNQLFMSNAAQMIGQLQALGKRVGNADFIALAELLYGDLMRFGWNEEPTKENLMFALQCNEQAIQSGSKNLEVTLSVLINIGEILIDLEGPEQAKPYIEEACRIFFERADLRIIRWAEEKLRAIAQRVGLLLKRPKSALFVP